MAGSAVELVDFRKNFPVLGESVLLLLGENQFTVHLHFEYPTAGGDEFRCYLVFFSDGASQTGGAWFVVSNLAVFDGDLHEDPP